MWIGALPRPVAATRGARAVKYSMWRAAFVGAARIELAYAIMQNSV